MCVCVCVCVYVCLLIHLCAHMCLYMYGYACEHLLLVHYYWYLLILYSIQLIFQLILFITILYSIYDINCNKNNVKVLVEVGLFY